MRASQSLIKQTLHNENVNILNITLYIPQPRSSRHLTQTRLRRLCLLPYGNGFSFYNLTAGDTIVLIFFRALISDLQRIEDTTQVNHRKA